VRASLEATVPRLDDEIPVLLADGLTDRLKQRVEAAPELSIFQQRDYGLLYQLYGYAHKAVQYEIGNPLKASWITRRRPAVGLYVPQRVILYETDAGRSCVEYHLPASLLYHFDGERIDQLNAELERTLSSAVS